MKQIDSLFALAEAYGGALQIGEARVSSLVFNDGKRLKRVREGADIGSRSIERAFLWFSHNWPPSVEWPAGVPRPVPELASSLRLE